MEVRQVDKYATIGIVLGVILFSLILIGAFAVARREHA
jgi:hypothetical protein